MAASFALAPSFPLQNPTKTLAISAQRNPLCIHILPLSNGSKHSSLKPLLHSKSNALPESLRPVSGHHPPSATANYEFSDSFEEVELRLDIGSLDIQSSGDIFLDSDESSLLIRAKASGSLLTLMETTSLYGKIKPSETIWYIDEDQLVVNLKKHDTDLKWHDAVESWGSLSSGIVQLLKGASIYIVGESTEINQRVANVLASGIGYTPLYTSDLLERYAQRPINSWVIAEGVNTVAEAEGVVLESLSSHVRTVVSTLGGMHGAARRPDKWQHLHAGFTIWLSESEATDEALAKEEARRHIQDGSLGYSSADVVVKLGGWANDGAQAVAQASLSALKRLLLSDKQLAGKKSLYIRLGCRGDWPNIKPPGWDPSTGVDSCPKS